MSAASGRAREVIAWDLPTRLFHWTLVALVAGSWASFEFAERIGDHQLRMHRMCGVAVIVLLLWRLLWGLFGSRTARFQSFIGGPARAAGYARDLMTGRPRHFLGHNPLGAYLIVTLLGLVLAQSLLGLFTVEHNDITNGPLYRLVAEDAMKAMSRLHRIGFDLVLVPLIALHVAANILYGAVKGEPLIRAMVTGRKPSIAYEDAGDAGLVSRPLARALGLLLLSAGAVLGTLHALSGKFY